QVRLPAPVRGGPARAVRGRPGPLRASRPRRRPRRLRPCAGARSGPAPRGRRAVPSAGPCGRPRAAVDGRDRAGRAGRRGGGRGRRACRDRGGRAEPAPGAPAQGLGDAGAVSTASGNGRQASACAGTIPPMSARVYALANQKGGVGKTTTAINMAACVAEAGTPVLLIDLDPQANATTGLGFRPEQLTASTYDLLHGTPLRDVVLETAVPNLYLVPSHPDLAAAQV